MAQQYVNIRLILDKILRHPLLQDITLEAAVDYTVDFMRIVGVPNMFEEKITKLKVDKYRALLPDDFYQMIQVRCTKNNKAFRYADSSFHLSEDKQNTACYTYKIQGGIIYTSTEKGEIEISYEAIPVDDEGYPLLPDNSDFTRALELYIKKEHFTTLFDLGKISPQVYQNTLQQYAWAVGDCESEFNRLSLDEAESFYNSWKNLVIKNNAHRDMYKNLGSK